MSELIAIEYRQARWETAAELAHRVGDVTDRLAEAGVAAIGVAGLFVGSANPLRGLERPAVLFGLRAHTMRAVVAVGQQLAMRGYSGLFTGVDGDVPGGDPELVAGHGMVYAPGGGDRLYGASPAKVREAFDAQAKSTPAGWPPIRMPGVDEVDRAVDGVYLEEAHRREIGLIWVPGSGINEPPFAGPDEPTLVGAREDGGELSPEELVGWAAGDRVERGRVRLKDLTDRPRRWLQRLAGLR